MNEPIKGQIDGQTHVNRIERYLNRKTHRQRHITDKDRQTFRHANYFIIHPP